MSQVLRFIDGKAQWVTKGRGNPLMGIPVKPINDSLGCIAQDVEKSREDARIHGFTGIEWRPDPTTMVDGKPTSYQCHASSDKELARYAKFCHMDDRAGRKSGVSISQEDLDAAARRVSEQYGPKQRKGRSC